MIHSASFIFSFFLSIIVFVSPFELHAAGSLNQASNVFKFQQKLAINGNVNAQYKLGSMYEIGEGIEADIEQAKQWYQRAAEAGSVSAKQRYTYLIVKEQGYDQAKNSEWLKNVKKDASQRKPDAVLLLAQLYHQGLGVKKDLNKSLELFNQIRVLGTANVEKEITLIRSKIDAINKAELAKQQKHNREQVRLEQANKERQNKKQADKEKQVETVLRSKKEKRKRYEEVMRKLKLEQQLIDQQQSEVTGNKDATVDDEI